MRYTLLLLSLAYLPGWIGSAVAQVTDPATTTIKAPSTARTYAVSEPTLYYKLDIESDFGGDRKQKSSATVVYRLKKNNSDQIEVRCESVWHSYSSGGDTGFYRLGSQRTSSPLPTTIKPSGEATDVRHPQWVMGLPVDVGRFAFPQLSQEDQWTKEEPVTLVAGYSNQLQLLPIAPHIKKIAPAFRRSSANEAKSDAVTISKTISRVTSQTDRQLTIEEVFELDGTVFSPSVSVVGKGQVKYSKDRQSVDSVQRSYIVTWEEPNRQMIVPISMKMERLDDEAIKTYEAAVLAKEQRMQELRANIEAMRNAVPDLADKAAVMLVVEESEKEAFDALIEKLYSQKVSNDPQLAKAIYKQLFQRDRVAYHTKAVITQLDSSLEKTVALADKYSKSYSSFDIALTGDTITPDAELTKRQIICYRQRSDTFQPAHFYGAVEDVLVLETRDSTPKLIAVKREQCRYPNTDFLDPVLMEAGEPQAETENDQ